jgi:Na+-driven multidrug efflux pump
MVNMLLQNIMKGTQASIVAISRQGLFFLPAVMILPRMLGILGVQISQPVSDVLTFLLTIPMGINVLRELKSMQQEQEKENNSDENISREVTEA